MWKVPLGAEWCGLLQTRLLKHLYNHGDERQEASSLVSPHSWFSTQDKTQSHKTLHKKTDSQMCRGEEISCINAVSAAQFDEDLHIDDLVPTWRHRRTLCEMCKQRVVFSINES